MSQPMGEERRVVPFAAPQGRMRRRAVEETGARGAILFFTGVRYERTGVAAPAVVGQAGAPLERNPRRGN